jgi:hypothetical protein
MKKRQDPHLFLQLLAKAISGYLLLLLLSVGAGQSACFADKPAWPGIWAIWSGHDISNHDKPWYRGAVLASTWKSVEVAQGRYNFSDIDQRVSAAVQNGLFVGLIFYIDNPPEWVYAAGVPKVQLSGTYWNTTTTEYPYSVHPKYRELLMAFIDAVATHVKSYPVPIREKIKFIQCPTGKSGDPSPYPGWLAGTVYPLDLQYAISKQEWETHSQLVFSAYMDAYRDADPPVGLLFNTSKENFDYFFTRVPHLFIKAMGVGQGYALKGEFHQEEWDHTLLTRFTGNRAVRGRAEFDHGPNQKVPWYTEAPVWNMYWQCLWALTYGLDVLNLHENQLKGKNAEFHEQAYRFFSAYAGYKDALDSHGAWCALRDGLDCDDTKRFPVGQYGAVRNGENLERYQRIVTDHAKRGAQIGDLEVLATKGDLSKTMKALNDVSYRTWRGNYGMFLRQIEPDATSVGWWRVGNKSQPYGRYARGFEHAMGRDKMFFDIADAFFDGKSLKGQYPVKVRVVYFDRGNGSWSLLYDAVDGSMKTAKTVTKTNSGQWKSMEVVLPDAYFGNRGPKGADLMLQNTDTEDDLFHLIEVTRETGDRKGYWGMGLVSSHP